MTAAAASTCAAVSLTDASRSRIRTRTVRIEWSSAPGSPPAPNSASTTNSGRPSDSARSVSAGTAGRPPAVAAATRAATESRSSRSSRTSRASGTASSIPANTDPGSSRSSGRQVRTRSKGRAARRRDSQASVARVASSAHWTSSIAIIPGDAPATSAVRPSAIASMRRVRAAGSLERAEGGDAPGPCPPASPAGSATSRSSSVRVRPESVPSRDEASGNASPARRSSTIGA